MNTLHNGMKTELYQTNANVCSSTFCIDNYYCCACIIIVKHQSVINKYMQKAGEPENDAVFLKVIIIAAVYVAS